jgi:hypothetical protein
MVVHTNKSVTASHSELPIHSFDSEHEGRHRSNKHSPNLPHASQWPLRSGIATIALVLPLMTCFQELQLHRSLVIGLQYVGRIRELSYLSKDFAQHVCTSQYFSGPGDGRQRRLPYDISISILGRID